MVRKKVENKIEEQSSRVTLRDLIKDIPDGTTIFIHKYREQGNIKIVIGQDVIEEKLLNAVMDTVMHHYGGKEYDYNSKLYIVK